MTKLEGGKMVVYNKLLVQYDGILCPGPRYMPFIVNIVKSWSECIGNDV